MKSKNPKRKNKMPLTWTGPHLKPFHTFSVKRRIRILETVKKAAAFANRRAAMSPKSREKYYENVRAYLDSTVDFRI